MRVEDKYESKAAFATEARDTTEQYFKPRIANCQNIEWLREAVTVEAQGEARKDRIAFINKQISNLE